jgi:predicted adenylyl cyclase CyaB
MTDPFPLPAPRSNIELKACLRSLAEARTTAERLATERLASQHQIDTYFSCRVGRLKLREIIGQRSELIWYERPDLLDAKASRYCLVPVEEAAAIRHALAGALGVRCVVDKHREIYLHHNVRIHLDRVKDLGEFLEFEAVLGPDITEELGYRQVAFLRGEFRIADADLLTGSYADLLTVSIHPAPPPPVHETPSR